MLREAFSLGEDDSEIRKDRTKGLTMVMLSVATSIDALAVGFSMSLLQISIIGLAIIIGIVCTIGTFAVNWYYKRQEFLLKQHHSSDDYNE